MQMKQDNELETLTLSWLAAKKAEKAANDKRIGIEKDILAIVKPNAEGRMSLKLGNGYKLTLDSKMIYKGDCDKLEAMSADWPDEYQVVRLKKDLNETKLKEIRTYRPEVWLRMSEIITMKPAKVSVSIERIEE
jgi:hypothetical protein